MTVIDDPFEPTDPGDAALDRLLAQARWDVPAGAEERLRDRWVALSRKRRIRAPVYGMLAAAAGIAVVAGTILLLENHARFVAGIPLVEESAEVKYLMIPPSPSPHVESRPATLLEELALMQGPPTAAQSPPTVRVQPAEPRQNGTEITELTRRLGDMRLENRFAAAQALAAMDDPNVVSALAEMVRQGINVREALLTLRLSKSTQASQTLDALAISSACRAQLAADLWSLQNRI